jgi:DNA-binding NarL/FixJ family response regulator
MLQTVTEPATAGSAYVASERTHASGRRLHLLPSTDTPALESVFSPLEDRPTLVLLPVAPLQSLGARINRLHPDTVILALQSVSAAPWQQDPVLRNALAVTPAVLLAPTVNSNAQRLAAELAIASVLPLHLSPRQLLAGLYASAAGLAITLPQQFEKAAEPSRAKEKTPRDMPLVEHLTPREAAVLDRMAHGCGNKQIAAQLDISEHTAKFHVSSILAKLSASSRTEAVTIGILTGLIAI